MKRFPLSKILEQPMYFEFENQKEICATYPQLSTTTNRVYV